MDAEFQAELRRAIAVATVARTTNAPEDLWATLLAVRELYALQPESILLRAAFDAILVIASRPDQMQINELKRLWTTTSKKSHGSMGTRLRLTLVLRAEDLCHPK